MTQTNADIVRSLILAQNAGDDETLRIPRSWIYRLEDGRIVAVESFAGRAAAQRAWESLAGPGE